MVVEISMLEETTGLLTTDICRTGREAGSGAVDTERVLQARDRGARAAAGRRERPGRRAQLRERGHRGQRGADALRPAGGRRPDDGCGLTPEHRPRARVQPSPTSSCWRRWGSLSVALENARLVHETRQATRTRADQRRAGVAVAGELDPQAIYEAVGDRIREAFDAQTVTIGPSKSRRAHALSVASTRRELQAEPAPSGRVREARVGDREPLLLTENLDEEAERYGSTFSPASGQALVCSPARQRGQGDRHHLAPERRPRARVRRDGQAAPDHAGRQPERRAREARLVQETRSARARATVNSVGQDAPPSSTRDALIELVGDSARDLRRDIAYVARHDEAAGTVEFAYYYESGERRPEAPMVVRRGPYLPDPADSRAILPNRREQHEKKTSLGNALPLLPRGADPRRQQGDRRDQRPEHRRGGTGPGGRLAPARDDRRQRGRRDPNARLRRGRRATRTPPPSSDQPAAVIVMDRDELVTEWNPAAAETFAGRRRRRSAATSTTSCSATGRGRKDVRSPGRRSRGRAQRITRRMHKDGTPLDVELMLVPLRRSPHAGPPSAVGRA